MSASIREVLPSAAGLLGHGTDQMGLGERVGDVRRVLVVLVDGMGYHLLAEMAPHAPLLAGVLAGQVGTLDELTCEFPSTTPVSLVSLGTGVRPGEHGVLGFTARIPGTDQVLNHILWRDQPPARQWQPVTTWFQRLDALGVPSAVVLPAAFAGSGLTEAAYGGARFVGVEDGANYADALLAAVGAGGLVYGYVAELDTAMHRYGIASRQWQEAAAHVDALLARIVEGLPPDAALLVLADHGGLDIAPNARIDLAGEAELRCGVQLVTGEPRVRYLHTRPGARADVIATWRAVLGPVVDVRSRDEAIAAGLFGPVPARHLDRIGDVVVVCAAPVAILGAPHEPAQVAELVGMHGALSAAETAVPLITVRG